MIASKESRRVGPRRCARLLVGGAFLSTFALPGCYSWITVDENPPGSEYVVSRQEKSDASPSTFRITIASTVPGQVPRDELRDSITTRLRQSNRFANLTLVPTGNDSSGPAAVDLDLHLEEDRTRSLVSVVTLAVDFASLFLLSPVMPIKETRTTTLSCTVKRADGRTRTVTATSTGRLVATLYDFQRCQEELERELLRRCAVSLVNQLE